MEPFEYLAVLISLILGLGITQLLTGFGRWLEHRRTVSVYGPAVAWAGTLLIVHIQTWWAMFGLRSAEEWNFLQFTIVLLQPIILFLLGVLIFPGAASVGMDLRSNFFTQRRWFFGLLMALLVVSVTKDLILSGELPAPMNLAFHAILFVISAAGFVTERDAFQRMLAYAGLVFVPAYIALLFARLS